MSDPARYDRVAAVLPDTLPPLTRLEAERAARRIYKKFGKRDDGARFVLRKRGAYVFRSWISKKPTTNTDHSRGWGALIHNTSHRMFRFRHGRTLRTHDPQHAHLEGEIAAYVAASGWLSGTLKPAERPESTPAERTCAEIQRLQARRGRWAAKARRAENAIRKLDRQIKYRENKLLAGC